MYAAGMTLVAEKYEEFKAAFEKVVQETIPVELLTPEITIDAEIDFAAITPKLTRILKQFEPFGPQNMTPIFLTKSVKDTGYGKPLGQDNEHLKLFVKQSRNVGTEGIDAIGFGLGNKLERIKNGQTFDMAYSIDENEWNGKVSLQLRARDLKDNETN